MDISSGLRSAAAIPDDLGRFLAWKRGFHLHPRRRSSIARAGPIEAVETSFVSLQEFLTAMPRTSAMGFLAIALTAVAGTSSIKAGMIGSSVKAKKSPRRESIDGASSGYWLLALNPSPFNRFVVARWPSIVFESTGDDDRHCQKLDLSSRQMVAVRSRGFQDEDGSKMAIEYQRKCIWTEDGGSLALDWPTSLDLDGDHGLDTTLLIIPGTAEGSRDDSIENFAREALQSGYFSVVLNPRGCGNSPLTTPRIFSAGDSDDIHRAVSYIAQCRPWTTLVGVGWGFGANMLVKYLGEERSTPLTAAVCINNPFDLDEATSYMKQKRSALDKELTNGFVKILESNKFLFQGQASLDLSRGLRSRSVRDFETAITCPANGFKSLESYYRSASSRNFIDEVQTPLLCIQDSTMAPPFAIPQTSFEENPFTTLLYSSGNLDSCSNFHIAQEWFGAVEIALLKGRHPLLRGIDLTIKPSKEWSTNLTKGLLEGGDEYITLESNEDFWTPKEETEPEQDHDQQNEESHQENEEAEHGQAKQAAETIFGALDMAMPGTLSPETKQQVLDAVGRGETVLTALQNAVPEDVRGKMATAVSAAVQTRGISLKLVGFRDSTSAPAVPNPVPAAADQERKPDATKSSSSDQTSSNSDTDAPKVSETTQHGAKQDEAGSDQSKDSETMLQTEKPIEQAPTSNSSDPAPAKPEMETSSQNSENQHIPSQQTSTSSINVQHAFQAFSGFDDSTQMAVNNVFGVLEGMLDQIEKEKGNEAPQDQARHSAAAAAVPVGSNGRKPENSSAAATVAKNTTTVEHIDEVKDVHTRLKKTKISGFVLHGDRASADRKASSGDGDGLSKEHLIQAENVVLEAVKVEVRRRLGSASPGVIGELETEISRVSRAAVHHVDTSSGRVLSAEGLVDAVASTFQETSILQKVLPFGVLVGVILASLVNSYAVVTTKRENEKIEEETRMREETLPETSSSENPVAASEEIEKGFCGNVVGAVTAAAMGATAALASSGSSRDQQDEGDDDSYKENIVTSIAEKAFSIAAPVVPTKDGQIDHERLVSMLTDIGQKAGFLNFIAKAALLWGGLRGAMNVTERLLVYFKIAEQPLHRRLLGFLGMTLLLWSPIFIPLMPSLLNEWAAHSSGGVAQCACVVGLYGALIILIIIWGKKIRGFDQPLHQYGLRMKRLNLFAAGLAAGCAVVYSFYFMLSQFRYVKFVSSFMVTASVSQTLLSLGKLAKLTLEALLIGISIAPVEELIFRSWLLEEIAVDLGEHRAILLSSLLFAVIHWTPSALPGLWFLGIALAGARSKSSGNLALPIGLHAGLIAANFVLTCGGFVVYLPKSLCWLTGVHANSPLAGVFGAAVAAIFAAVLFPWNVLAVETKLVKHI